jgi:hypothetical protein
MRRLRKRLPQSAKGGSIGGDGDPPWRSRFLDEPLPGAPETDWTPLPAVAGAVAAGFPSYFIAEAALQQDPHPVHWVVTMAGSSVGYLGGLLFHRIRGY